MVNSESDFKENFMKKDKMIKKFLNSVHFWGKEHYCPKEGLDKYFPGCQECPYYSICPRKDKGWKFGFYYLKPIKDPEIKNFKSNTLDEYFFKFSMERLDNVYPNLNEVHLFYSGPSPIAFI